MFGMMIPNDKTHQEVETFTVYYTVRLLGFLRLNPFWVLWMLQRGLWQDCEGH